MAAWEAAVGMLIETGEARTRLFELLARVEAGETVTIARGDVPVAWLVPVARRDDAQAAVAGARLGADLQLYQSLGREADHLAEQVRIAALLNDLA